MKKTKSVMPVSRAKTAYGLLADIRRLILAEPRRYRQTAWLSLARLGDYPPSHGYPQCGTVGCVAGWVTTLTHKRPGSFEREGYTDTLRTWAADVLGLSERDAEELFFEGAAGYDAQTAEHAQRGAEHIGRFMKAHAKQLKAKRVQAISQRGTR